MADTYLLDTHTLLWWWGQPDKLSRRVLALLTDPSVPILVSAASAWEVATKARIGKLPGGEVIVATFAQRLAEDGFATLPVTIDHALQAGQLPGRHRDPFDQMLAAQARAESLPIVGCDTALDGFGVTQIW
jgi:PIN domain nuclease of toxin-antitoxin system